MRTKTKLAATLAALATLAAMTACSPAASEAAPEATTASVEQTAPATPRPKVTATTDAAYTAAVAAYPRELPEGYEFPTLLVGAESADRWWWCSQIDAAWEAYFRGNDETAALGYLAAAADVDPGSYGPYDSTDSTSLPIKGKVDRDVRLIDGGVDSQYLEYTAAGCWKWAESVGEDFPPMS